MAVVTLRMHQLDADLVVRVLMALVARPDECDAVLFRAGVERPVQADAVRTLVRVANYAETVIKERL